VVFFTVTPIKRHFQMAMVIIFYVPRFKNNTVRTFGKSLENTNRKKIFAVIRINFH